MEGSSSRFIPGVLAALTLLAAAPAARADGLDPVPNKLAITQGSFLTLEGARVGTKNSYRLALAVDGAGGILALRLGEQKIGNLVESGVAMHALGSWVALPWLQLGADLPLTVYQNSGLALLASSTGLPQPSIASFAAGDIRLLSKARVLEESKAPLTLAALVEARLPTGDETSYLGERGPVLWTRAAAERTFGRVRVSGELGYRLRDKPGRALNLYVGNEFTFGAGAAVRISNARPAWTLTGEIQAATPARAPFASGDALVSPLEALLGIGASVIPGVHATFGLGRGLASDTGYGREAVRVFLVVSLEHAATEVTQFDRDGDGIADAEDRCPDDPGPGEYDGCPDRDGDEIPDIEDKCPDVPGVAEKAGCPSGPAAALHAGKIDIEGAVNFDTNQATLKAESLPVLDAVVLVVKDHPEVARLLVEGHTDSVGPSDTNLDLSRRRAAAVVVYMIRKGIHPDRLISAGKGEDVPIATNDTALGRAKNRRVEFTVSDLKK